MVVVAEDWSVKSTDHLDRFYERKQFVQHLLGILHTCAMYSAVTSSASTSSGFSTVSEAKNGVENMTSDAAFCTFPLHCLHIS